MKIFSNEVRSEEFGFTESLSLIPVALGIVLEQKKGQLSLTFLAVSKIILALLR
jgi:hypothetical protein